MQGSGDCHGFELARSAGGNPVACLEPEVEPDPLQEVAGTIGLALAQVIEQSSVDDEFSESQPTVNQDWRLRLAGHFPTGLHSSPGRHRAL
jgi:hypothetical protein